MTQKTKFVMKSISTSDITKFKDLDKSKYVEVKKPKKVSRSPFDNGLSQIRTTFG